MNTWLIVAIVVVAAALLIPMIVMVWAMSLETVGSILSDRRAIKERAKTEEQRMSEWRAKMGVKP